MLLTSWHTRYLRCALLATLCLPQEMAEARQQQHIWPLDTHGDGRSICFDPQRNDDSVTGHVIDHVSDGRIDRFLQPGSIGPVRLEVDRCPHDDGRVCRIEYQNGLRHCRTGREARSHLSRIDIFVDV